MDYRLVAELCYRKYSGGNPSADSGLKPADFEYSVLQARAYKIRDDFIVRYKLTGEKVIGQSWIRQYQVPVVFNETTNQYYSVLPSQVLDLPYNLGMWLVSPVQNIQEPFMQQSIGEAFIFMRNPPDNINYHFDMVNIYYDNFNAEIENVFLAMVPLIDEQIPDEFALEIRDLVMKLYMPEQQEDKLTNQNPNLKEVANA